MYANDYGFGAYQGEASQINSNIQNWRADVDNVKGVNKQIRQEYQQKVDLDSIRNFTSELGAKGFKDVVAKAGSKLYRYKNPYTDRSIRDWDVEKTGDIEGYVKDRVGKLTSRTPDEEGVELQDLGNDTQMKAGEGVDTSVLEQDGSKVSEKLGAEENIPEQEVGEEGESLLDYFRRISRQPLGDEGEQLEAFQADTQLLQRPNQAEAKSSQVEPQEEEKYADEVDEINAGNQAYTEKVSEMRKASEDMEAKEEEDIADEVKEAGETEGGIKVENGKVEAGDIGEGVDDVAEKAGEGLAEEAGESVAESAGLEGAGAVLDATGVGAVIGVPLQIAGAIIDGGLLYEAGKSIYDWFDEDILGHKPQVPQNELLQVPSRPMTLAEKGYGVIPNRDTIDSQVSYSSGW